MISTIMNDVMKGVNSPETMFIVQREINYEETNTVPLEKYFIKGNVDLYIIHTFSGIDMIKKY